MVVLESKKTEESSEDIDCVSCPLRSGSPFCGRLNECQLERFSEIKNTLSFQKGEAIFYRGNSNHGVYIVCRGSVLISELAIGQKSKAIGAVFPGDLIDKTTFLDDRPHLITAEALESTEVTFFKHEEFITLIKEYDVLSTTVMHVLSDEIQTSRKRVRDLLYKKGQQRLAGLLLLLSKKCGQKTDHGTVIPIVFKREQLADMVGMTLESLVRWLSYFKKEKWVGYSGKKIIIFEEEKLQQIYHILS